MKHRIKKYLLPSLQVEFADLLVLNKCDLVPAEQLGELEVLLRKLNATAKVQSGC